MQAALSYPNKAHPHSYCILPGDHECVDVVRGGRILGVVLEEEVSEVLAILTRPQLEVAVAGRGEGRDNGRREEEMRWWWWCSGWLWGWRG